MSARDRAQKAAQQRDEDRDRKTFEGMRETLASPNGRALIWSIYADHIDAEGPGSKGRRYVARDLLRLAVLMDFDGVQMMREENERMSTIRKQKEKAEPDEGEE